MGVVEGKGVGLRSCCVGYRALTEDTPCIVAILDRELEVLEASPNACTFLDLPEDEVVGSKFRDLLPAPVRDERFAIAQQVIRAGHPARLVGMVRGVWLYTTYRPILDTEGAVGGMMICSTLAGRTPVQGSSTMVIHAHTHDLGRLSVLSRRELEVLRMLGRGKSLTDIAKKLYRSQRTIESHRRSLGSKLGVRTSPELARLAVEAGLCWIEPADFTRLLELMHNDADPDGASN